MSKILVFTSIKNPLQHKKALKLLAFLVSATTVPTPPATVPAGFAYVPEKDAALLAKSEPLFFSVDAATKDPSGNVKVVALQPAIDAANAIAAESASTPPVVASAPMTFVIEDGFTLPVVKRGGKKADIYPFDKIEVGQSFFVPATEAKPNPAKVLASTVSSATKRYKTETPARKFTVRARKQGETEGSPLGKAEVSDGARIYRIV